MRPLNTSTVAIHCLGDNTLPNKITDAKTVKNFLVVVTIEHGNGPNSVTVKKMNIYNLRERKREYV